MYTGLTDGEALGTDGPCGFRLASAVGLYH